MKAISFFYISIIAVFIYCLTSFSCSAQLSAKGYKGKRFSVNYDLFTFPNLSNYTYVGTTGPLAWNTRHYLGASYVVGRNQELSLQVGYHRTGLALKYDENSQSQGQNSFGYITGLDYVFTFKFYPFRRKGVLAPVGPYFGLGLMVGMYTCRDSMATEINKASSLIIKQEESFNFLTYALKMDFGAQRVIKDRFIFRFGLQLVPTAYLYSSINQRIGSFLSPVRTRWDNFQNYDRESDARARVNANVFMSFNVGLGYLIF